MRSAWPCLLLALAACAEPATPATPDGTVVPAPGRGALAEIARPAEDPLSFGEPTGAPGTVAFSLEEPDGGDALCAAAQDGTAYLVARSGRARRVNLAGQVEETRTLGLGSLTVTAVDGDGRGALSAVGGFRSADFGAGPLPSHPAFHGDADPTIVGAFALRLSGSGKLLWARSLPGRVPLGVRLFGPDVAIWGITFKTDQLGPEPLAEGPYLALLGATGAVEWATPGAQLGGWVVEGEHLLGAHPAQGLTISDLDARGGLVKRSVLASPEHPAALAVTAQHLIIGGDLTSFRSMDYGSGALPKKEGVALVALSRASHEPVWTRAWTFDGGGAEASFYIALKSLGALADGGVLVAGVARGSLPANAPFPAGGERDWFLASVDARGHQRWVVRSPLDTSCQIGARDNVTISAPIPSPRGALFAIGCAKRPGTPGQDRSFLIGVRSEP